MNLRLVLTGHWFDQIESGEKTVEYREMKPHWQERIWDKRHSLIGECVIFSRGYTKQTTERRIHLIDVGPCPYDGWDDIYYRVHFNNWKPKEKR